MSDYVRPIGNERQFREAVMEAKRPVAVLFSEDWCPHCRRFSPAFDRLAEEFADRVDFARVDSGELEELSNRFYVWKIPTVVLFLDGQPIQTWVNQHDLDAYRHMFTSVLSSKPK